MIQIPPPEVLLAAALAFFRIGGIVFALPIFGDQPIPVRARTFLAVALTLAVYPVLPAGWAPDLNVSVLRLADYIVRELSIGLVIGFIGRLAFDSMIMSASFVAYQMGFGTGKMFMAGYQSQVDAFSAFHRGILILVFLGINLHHVFFSALVETFHIIPGGAASLNGNLGTLFITISTGMFSVALQLAAPIMIALMFTMAALGLMARTVPQMNVFTLSFPLSFFLGLSVYMATIPFFPEWMRAHFMGVQSDLILAIRGLSP